MLNVSIEVVVVVVLVVVVVVVVIVAANFLRLSFKSWNDSVSIHY